ncbi:type II-A CRISPR-associated protein Csn2 [Weissella confusa]|uniref:Type II-A CRISPR-associated protein Csn2 n=1 Tax=Weissella fermenti TaxID=2987699 RepID=A0ABT6D4A9_9LACO|nr:MULTISPECIES: type II-A CRISPR-associated protein Csn2 [Weissella]MBJ7687789.1 type II-A CRISPR-associated protein Csn2 [Weissella confusa]MCW0927058.1 type II-A CRISPR-associated protein Csn2 [Weissella sp. LMG 11983]MDF9299493.1 type II-A CRISPR-associated protein Csn2 [Weissella sp. BK2]
MHSFNFDFLDETIKLEGLVSFTIEDRDVFTKVIQALYQYAGEEHDYLKIYDHNFKSLKTSELMIVNDILGFDINSPATLRLIYQDIENQISQDPAVKSEIERLLNATTLVIQNELLEFDIDLVSDEIEIAEALKILGVKIEVEADTIFERLFEIIQVFKYLKSKKLMVLVNTGVYLSAEEMSALEEYVSLQQMDLLMLDATRVVGLNSRWILDSDYVLMYENMV